MLVETTQLPCPVCQRSQASGYRGSSRVFLHPGPLGDHIRGKHPKWAKKHADSHFLWRRAFLSPPTSSVSGDSSCENSPVAPTRIGLVQTTSFTSVVSSFVNKRTQAQDASESSNELQAPRAIHAPTNIYNSPSSIPASLWDRELMSPEPRVIKSEVLAALTCTSEESFHEMWSRPNSAYPQDSAPEEGDLMNSPKSRTSTDSLLSLYSAPSQSDVNSLPFPLKETDTSPTPVQSPAMEDVIVSGSRSEECTPIGSKQLDIDDWTVDFETQSERASTPTDLSAFLETQRCLTPDSALSPSTTLLGIPSDTEAKIGACCVQEAIQEESFWPSDEGTPQTDSFPSRESTPRTAENALPPVPVLAGDFSLSPSESRQGAIYALRASQKGLGLVLQPVLATETQPLRPKRSPMRSQSSFSPSEKQTFSRSRNISMESDGWMSHSPDVCSTAPGLSPLPPMPSPLPGTPSSSDWEYEASSSLGPLPPIIEVDEAHVASPAKTAVPLHPLIHIDETQPDLLAEPSTPCPKSAVSMKSVRFEDEIEDIREEAFPSAYVSTDESDTSLKDYNEELLNDIDCLQSETFPAGFVCATPDLYSPVPGPSTAPQTSHVRTPNPPKVLSRMHCRSCFKDPCEEITATMCGHIFCNRCIIDAVVKTSKCPCCNAPTLLYCLFRLDLA